MITYNFHMASRIDLKNYGVYKMNNADEAAMTGYANLVNTHTAPGAKMCMSKALVSYEKRSLPAVLEDWKTMSFTLYSSTNPKIQKSFKIRGIKVLKDGSGVEDEVAMAGVRKAIIDAFIALQPLADDEVTILDRRLMPGFGKTFDVTQTDNASTDATP